MTRFLAGVVALASAFLVAQQASYRIAHTYTLGGDGSWDYVVPDPPNHRLFIARQTRVMVVDEDSGKLLGEVPNINGAHGTAIAASTGHGFATSGNDQAVVMFDLKTFQPLKTIPAAEDADAIVYDGASNRVFTLNGDAHSSTVIDPREGAVITNVPLGGKPEYGASAGDGKVYANLTDVNEVVEIDAKTATVSRRWPTAPCRNPVSMAIDTTHKRVFSGCRSGVLAVSDYANGHVVTTVPIGMGVGRCRLRPITRRRVCLECRRHADSDSSGFRRPVPCRADRHDTGRLAEHGDRSHDASPLSRVGALRAATRDGPGSRPCRAWHVRGAGDRTIGTRLVV